MENFKYAKIEKIIHQSYNLNQEFSIFNAESNEKSENINKTFTRLTMPFKTDFELIKAIELFAESTRYSFKRINVHKERKKDIIFVCSCISPKKPGNAAACPGQAARSRKRLIDESCPMRLKFKWDEALEQFALTEDSNFNHNHEALSKSSEDYSNMSQSIRFPLRWIYKIFRIIFEIQHSNQNQNEKLDKKLNDIRNNILSSSNIAFLSSCHKTNFCKKLIYFIKKVYCLSLKAAATQTLEEKFLILTKYVLRRGANYLSHENLHLANFVLKAYGRNAFAFYEEFTKLVDSL